MKNKTALIITLYGNYNFGNKLQNYGMVFVLEKMGFSAHTANVVYRYRSHYKNMKSFCKRLLIRVSAPKADREREQKFSKFSNKYLKTTQKPYSTNAAKPIEKYDCLIYGSDQIWNPTCFGDSNLFLGYLGDKNKNIAYAASFGISALPQNLQDRYRKGLNNFQSISVREEQGAKIIRQLDNNKSAEVVIDPTLLLTREEWISIEKMPKDFHCKNYILIYFLGAMDENIRNVIYCSAQEYGLEIIDIMAKDSPYYAIGPEEFLYLAQNAALVCTDSFHSCVFSFIFDTPFLVFDRIGVENMSSRMDTFLRKFRLEDRKFSGEIQQEHFMHDYTLGYSILEWERKKSRCFLEQSLGLNSMEGN